MSMGKGGRGGSSCGDGVGNGGRKEHRKPIVVVTASTSGILALVISDHDVASRVEEKLLVMRGMMVVSSGATPDCGERE